MIQHSRTLRSKAALLVAPVLLSAFSGCTVYEAWQCRCETQVVASPGYQYGHSTDYGYNQPSTGIQPGHSTDVGEFNENYSPYDGEPSQSQSHEFTPETPSESPMERLSPPPAPPAKSNIPESKPDQPIIEQDVKHQQSTPENRLIKNLKTPRLFSPDSVRSIYDRFRNQTSGSRDTGSKPVAKPKNGPIAQSFLPDFGARAVRFTAAEEAVATDPVRLGLPETDLDPQPYQPYQSHPLQGSAFGQSPQVQQATPSHYKHPLLADPTGVPYRR